MSRTPLHMVVLGPGKTGSLVAEVARGRGHQVRTIDADVNESASWLTQENLLNIDVVIDFTTPHAVLNNIAACVSARKAMVVGTTGWYGEMERVRQAVEQAETGSFRREFFLRRESVLSDHEGCGASLEPRIQRPHHRDPSHPQENAPSGTAAAMQRILEQTAGMRLDITSEREGEVTGTHTD